MGINAEEPLNNSFVSFWIQRVKLLMYDHLRVIIPVSIERIYFFNHKSTVSNRISLSIYRVELYYHIINIFIKVSVTNCKELSVDGCT